MDEEKKYEEVSVQNQTVQQPTEGTVSDLTLSSGLSQSDKDRLDLARKTTEAIMPYQDVENMIRKQAAEYAPESEEDRKKRERREKSRRIIGAVTDGLSALGNLYFTSQYAPNMYNHEKQSQLAVVNRWADKLKADREARRDRYEALQGRLGQLGLDKARTVREIEAAHQQQIMAREKQKLAEEAAKRDAKLFEPKYQEALSRAEGAGYDAQTKKAAADAAPEQQKLKTENLGLEGQVKRSQIFKNTQQGKNAGGGDKKPFHFDGKEYTKDSENDYKNAITSAVDEVNNYFAQRNFGTGKIIRNDKGEVVYRADYEPISVGYDDMNGITRYFDWAETAAKAERALAKMRKEKEANKKGGSWSLKSEEKGSNGGWSLK